MRGQSGDGHNLKVAARSRRGVRDWCCRARHQRPRLRRRPRCALSVRAGQACVLPADRTATLPTAHRSMIRRQPRRPSIQPALRRNRRRRQCRQPRQRFPRTRTTVPPTTTTVLVNHDNRAINTDDSAINTDDGAISAADDTRGDDTPAQPISEIEAKIGRGAGVSAPTESTLRRRDAKPLRRARAAASPRSLHRKSRARLRREKTSAPIETQPPLANTNDARDARRREARPRGLSAIGLAVAVAFALGFDTPSPAGVGSVHTSASSPRLLPSWLPA